MSLSESYTERRQRETLNSPWKVEIGATWRTPPVAPGITGGPMRPRNLLQPTRIPGATGGHRQIPTFHGLYLGKSGKMYFVKVVQTFV